MDTVAEDPIVLQNIMPSSDRTTESLEQVEVRDSIDESRYAESVGDVQEAQAVSITVSVPCYVSLDCQTNFLLGRPPGFYQDSSPRGSGEPTRA